MTRRSGKSRIADAGEDTTCRDCVVRTIESECGTSVGSLTDKLRDVCAPCDTGAMADLADALRRNCDASANLRLTCSMSIIQVINAVCQGHPDD